MAKHSETTGVHLTASVFDVTDVREIAVLQQASMNAVRRGVGQGIPDERIEDCLGDIMAGWLQSRQNGNELGSCTWDDLVTEAIARLGDEILYPRGEVVSDAVFRSIEQIRTVLFEEICEKFAQERELPLEVIDKVIGMELGTFFPEEEDIDMLDFYVRNIPLDRIRAKIVRQIQCFLMYGEHVRPADLLVGAPSRFSVLR